MASCQDGDEEKVDDVRLADDHLGHFGADLVVKMDEGGGRSGVSCGQGGG